MKEYFDGMSIEEVLERLEENSTGDNCGFIMALVDWGGTGEGDVQVASSGMSANHFVGLCQVLMKFLFSDYADEDEDDILRIIMKCHVAFLDAASAALNEIEDPEQYKKFAAALFKYFGNGEDFSGEDNGQEEQDSSEG